VDYVYGGAVGDQVIISLSVIRELIPIRKVTSFVPGVRWDYVCGGAVGDQVIISLSVTGELIPFKETHEVGSRPNGG
jgi:hypothetical protein